MHTLESRKPDLMKEKLEGDFGEEGLENWNNPEPLVFFWSLGLLGVDEAVVAVATEVRHRRPRPGSGCRRDCERGVDGLEKNPNLELILGLWLWLWLLTVFSFNTFVSESLGIEVQNALLHPVIVCFPQSDLI